MRGLSTQPDLRVVRARVSYEGRAEVNSKSAGGRCQGLRRQWGRPNLERHLVNATGKLSTSKLGDQGHIHRVGETCTSLSSSNGGVAWRRGPRASDRPFGAGIRRIRPFPSPFREKGVHGAYVRVDRRRHPAARAQWCVGRWATPARAQWAWVGGRPALAPNGSWVAGRSSPPTAAGWWSTAPRTRRQLAWRRRLSATSTSRDYGAPSGGGHAAALPACPAARSPNLARGSVTVATRNVTRSSASPSTCRAG